MRQGLQCYGSANHVHPINSFNLWDIGMRYEVNGARKALGGFTDPPLYPGGKMTTPMNSLWEIESRVNLGSLSRMSSIRYCNRNTLHLYVPKKKKCFMILATTDGKSPPVTETKISEKTNTEDKSQKSDEDGPANNADGKRPPLTARERLRAARVISKYTESNTKPPKSEFGSKVLDAIRETDKGKKRGSRLPDAPTDLFDDSTRGLPKEGWTFNLPFGTDVLAIVFSFLFITTVMFGTTYLVWKVGAIHFNED